MKHFKYFGGVVVFLMVVVLVHPAFAWESKSTMDRYSYSGSTDIEVRARGDHGTETFRGTRENDGSTKVRDYYGSTLRGHTDADGYGRLRDENFNYYRVSPR